jgi:AcrR family transcriptional regulator
MRPVDAVNINRQTSFVPRTRATPADVRPAYHHGDLRRALVDAALALVTEEQDWGFSLREVARRAGVSHNAPYNHFADKRDLLAAVATSGFEALRAHLAAAVADAPSPEAALLAIGTTYVRFGLGNPAHYRLMFGPTLTTGEGGLPPAVAEAAAGAKAVLCGAIEHGAQTGRFAVSPASQAELDLAALSAWSLVHGLTMLAIDGLANTGTPSPLPEQVVVGVSRALIEGLRRR